MAKTTIAALDYSMSCPAICFHTGKSFSFQNCTFYFLTDIKKYIGSFLNGQINGHQLPLDWNSQEERFNSISELFINWIFDHNCKEVCLEGYSMASKGKVFHIGENTGLMKHKLWKQNINFAVSAPKQIKKFATGNGNASKEQMWTAFLENDHNTIDFRETMGYTNKTSILSPIGDIVDSFFICKHFFNLLGIK